ncbi:MAG: malate synthase A [Planctomycetes bacterium]|nr:malate synthase A [Planctomycetota bacterium]
MHRMGLEPNAASPVVVAPLRDAWARVLSQDALAFVAELTRAFRPELQALLAERRLRQDARRAGARLDFLPETASIRDAAWSVAPIPRALTKRVVEITGPVDRKMVINALNSGADVFMADFEDATAPTFANLVDGQLNLMDAVRRTLTFDDPQSGKAYRLADSPAVLLARPRGLHLPEKHVLVDGEPVPGALFDFGLFVFHNARESLARGHGPWFYLPKLEHWLEARWWDQVFGAAERRLGLGHGSIKATVLIETLPAAFQMDEILHALKDHVVGLNCGRWDYIFSFIKCHRHDAAAVLPDRGQVTMEQPFLRAYTQLLVKTCHRRGAFAMGGMAAQIPIKNDAAANERALERVRADKTREVKDGHDGTWVAHPALVPIARAVFAQHMRGDHQLDVMRHDVHVTAADLLAIPTGTRTEAGLRANLRIGVQYLEAWLRGAGCVPLEHLMEDAATAEISRTQIWQQLHWNAPLADGRSVDRAFVKRLLAEELAAIAHAIGPERFTTGRFAQARALFSDLCFAETLPEFLTLAAYDTLDESGHEAS